MSRYDDPEGMGEYPALGKRRRGPLGRRQPTEDTGAWSDQGQNRSSQQASNDRSRPQPGPGRPPGQSGKDRKGRSAPPGRLDSTRPQDRRSRLLGPRPALALTAIATTVMVVGVSLVAYAAVRNVYDGINHETVTAQMLGNRPPKLNGSTNILIIGSDSRAGTDGKFGRGVLGSRSDTSMLLHLSPDHTHAYVISFPRDSMVPIYSCLPDHEGHPGQTAAPGGQEMLNATFSAGGAPCLWKTLEQTTHIHIDHFVEVGFDSFQNIVNDVHGIKVCLPFAIHNPQAHLNLPAGLQTVNGAEALAFVRLRENIGDGSDLQRIQRQQLFLASAAQKIKQTNLLGDYKVLRDVGHAITTDLTLTQMLSIANSLKGLSTASVRFITVPVIPDPADVNRLLWETPQATTLFSAVAHDNHILKAAKAAKAKPVPTVSPSKVQLEVLNGSGIAGIAGTTAGEQGLHHRRHRRGAERLRLHRLHHRVQLRRPAARGEHPQEGGNRRPGEAGRRHPGWHPQPDSRLEVHRAGQRHPGQDIHGGDPELEQLPGHQRQPEHLQRRFRVRGPAQPGDDDQRRLTAAPGGPGPDRPRSAGSAVGRWPIRATSSQANRPTGYTK
jgi:LCP family protein required for cell wall assembly